jgi:hypothetical protein
MNSFPAGRRFSFEIVIAMTNLIQKRLLDLIETEKDDKEDDELRNMLQKVSAASAIGQRVLERLN